jgi:hypothetical protein
MATSTRIAPPNSLLIISDPARGETPEMKRGPRIWVTPSCIAIGCLAFMDGETEVTLGKSADVDPGGAPAFDGWLDTANRAVVVSTIEGKIVFEHRY